MKTLRSGPVRLGGVQAHGGGESRFAGAGAGGDNVCASEEDGPTGTCVHTWSYAPHRTLPHLVASFGLSGSATLSPSAVDPVERRLVVVRVRVRAGGVGHGWGSGRADGERVPGWALSVGALGRGGWLPLHESQAPPEAPSDETVTTDAAWTCGEPWCDDATPDRWPTARPPPVRPLPAGAPGRGDGGGARRAGLRGAAPGLSAGGAAVGAVPPQ